MIQKKRKYTKTGKEHRLNYLSIHMAEVYHYNNCTVRVYRPILTEEERARRMEAIKKAAVTLIIATEKTKQNKNR